LLDFNSLRTEIRTSEADHLFLSRVTFLSLQYLDLIKKPFADAAKLPYDTWSDSYIVSLARLSFSLG